jgi:hypothetical protein
MSYYLNLRDIDVIFLSYDEPNAEKNYVDLLEKVPYAKRVHGVKGSDAAHKACADISETENFVTVDADNIVDPAFLDLVIDFDEFATGDKSQFSWAGKNVINGLIYGNGGLKVWTREHVWNMRTHEAAEDNTNQVDFCWDPCYHHLPGCYSTVYNNATALQAFRAGFREGVKMSLIDGIGLRYVGETTEEKIVFEPTGKQYPRASKWNLNFKLLPAVNYQRLLIWQTIGQDVKNGLWAIYGARLGCYLTNWDDDFDYTTVRDFDALNAMFRAQELFIRDEQDLKDSVLEVGQNIQTYLKLPIADYDEYQSKFFKSTYVQTARSRSISVMDNFITDVKRSGRWFDVVFISNGEPNAEDNWQRLLTICPEAKRVDGVSGIWQAHYEAAKLVNTDMFYVVDADAWIVDTFDFTCAAEDIDHWCAHVYYSINPVNDLCYGYGGVKLFPTHVFVERSMREHHVQPVRDQYVDMTSSLGAGLKVIPTISNITRFNTDPFSSWRSAFRECAKMVSRSIDGQVNKETEYRLNTWLSKGLDPHVLAGAAAGHVFGTAHRDNPEMMQKINNYEFLKEMFDNEE